MNLLSAIRKECCTVDLPGKSRDEVLRALADLACRSPALAQIGPKVVYQKLREREEQGATGLGHGVALPHARVEGMEEFVIGVAVSRRRIDFQALDKKKCGLIFFILGPEQANAEHLKALAALSRQAGSPQVRAELDKAYTPTALYEALARRLGAGATAPQGRRAMKLMFLTLYMEDLLYDVLQFLLEAGVDGANILEGAGMGKYISNVPLFAEFIGVMQHRKEHSRTIMALVPAERQAQIVEGVEALAGDLDKNQGAVIVFLDATFHKGTMRMM